MGTPLIGFGRDLSIFQIRESQKWYGVHSNLGTNMYMLIPICAQFHYAYGDPICAKCSFLECLSSIYSHLGIRMWGFAHILHTRNLHTGSPYAKMPEKHISDHLLLHNEVVRIWGLTYYVRTSCWIHTL